MAKTVRKMLFQKNPEVVADVLAYRVPAKSVTTITAVKLVNVTAVNATYRFHHADNGEAASIENAVLGYDTQIEANQMVYIPCEIILNNEASTSLGNSRIYFRNNTASAIVVTAYGDEFIL